MVLSRTRGLSFLLVVRQGLGSCGRLGARSRQGVTYQLRLALEPECSENLTASAREIPRDGADSIRDTQAFRGVRYWASKLTPRFHTINTIAAIFRACAEQIIGGGDLLIHLDLFARTDFRLFCSRYELLSCATTPHLQSIVQQVFSKSSGGSWRQRQGRRAATPIALPHGHERLPRKYVCGVVPSIVRNISMKALTLS
jgi:hypothetical protein